MHDLHCRHKLYVMYPQVGSRWKHYKGGLYEVITMATHTETEEKMVVYKSLDFGTIYVRPHVMWNEVVKIVDGNGSTRRFVEADKYL